MLAELIIIITELVSQSAGIMLLLFSIIKPDYSAQWYLFHYVRLNGQNIRSRRIREIPPSGDSKFSRGFYLPINDVASSTLPKFLGGHLLQFRNPVYPPFRHWPPGFSRILCTSPFFSFLFFFASLFSFSSSSIFYSRLIRAILSLPSCI
jgi:hypothetical protein